MNHQNRLAQLFSPRPIDRAVAKLAVLSCALLLGLRLLTDQVLVVVIPGATGLACLLYLGVNYRKTDPVEFPALPRWVIGYLPSMVFLGLAVLVLAVHTLGRRTIPVYLLTGLIGSVILAQTLLVDDESLSSRLVLFQIIVAAVVIRMSVLLVTPGFVGVDIWTHVPVYIEGIVEAESLSAIADSKYSMAPFYHSIGAVAALVFDSARIGLYLTIGLLVPLSALLIYGAGKLFVPVRWALVATALYVFADQFIRWGLHIIPTSLGLVFFLGALYCVTKLFYTDELWVLALLLAFSLATVFTHQVSTAVVLVLLGVATAAVLGVRLFGTTQAGATSWATIGLLSTFIIILVVTIISWLNTPWFGDEPFLVQMIAVLQETLASEAGFLNLVGADGGGAGGTPSQRTGIVADVIPFIEWAGFGLLLLAAVLGGLAMLRQKPVDATMTYLASAATMFVVVFGFSLFGVRAILPGRWMAFLFALFAIMAAVGFYHLSQNASRGVLIAVFLLVAIGYPTTMVVAEKATLDSPALDDEHPRFSYTDSEIAAVETINEIYPPAEDRQVHSDHPYQSLFGRLGGYSSRVVELNEAGPVTGQAVVTRQYQTQGPARFNQAGEPVRPIASQSVTADQVCTASRNHVYANDQVRLCTVPGPAPGGNP